MRNYITSVVEPGEMSWLKKSWCNKFDSVMTSLLMTKKSLPVWQGFLVYETLWHSIFMAHKYFSFTVNVVCNGSPSLMRRSDCFHRISEDAGNPVFIEICRVMNGTDRPKPPLSAGPAVVCFFEKRILNFKRLRKQNVR